jgi:hypothetical protein
MAWATSSASRSGVESLTGGQSLLLGAGLQLMERVKGFSIRNAG